MAGAARMITFDLERLLQTPDGPLQLQADAQLDDSGFVTLFGPSGAGKTTLLRMLAGLTQPESGRIVVNDTTWFDSAAGIDVPPQQRAIGFVFQDYALFPNLNVRENVAYAVPRNDGGWVDELLDLMGLTGLQHRLPQRLSGGQKQRVALARALARKPSLLLLDEPLSALDAAARSAMQDDLLRLHQRLHFTALLVSHDVGEVFRLSQRVLRLEAGRIVQSGTPAEVFLRRRLAGRLQLHAQVLAIRREDVVHVVSLLIGQDIIDVIASDHEIASLREGDVVSVAAKAISPMIFRQ
jgi:molybdate transport system ATP-binding protein